MVLLNSEKKQKSKKQKTDPNLFLFSDVVDEEVEHAKQSSENNEISEIKFKQFLYGNKKKSNYSD